MFGNLQLLGTHSSLSCHMLLPFVITEDSNLELVYHLYDCDWEQMHIQVWNLEKMIDDDPIARDIFVGQRVCIIMDHLHTMKLQL